MSDDAASRMPLRHRVLPRSVLGLSSLIMAAAVGAAFSGTVLYAYYDYRLSKAESSFQTFKSTFDSQFKKAQDQLAAERDAAKNEVHQQLAPLEKIAAEGNTLSTLLKQVTPSIWFVHTQDEAGQPSVGSAFVVASDSTQTFLLSSYTTIRAATHSPGPTAGVLVRHGDEEVKATVWTWQADHDLALLVIPKANQPRLNWATHGPSVGDRIFAVSGLGSEGGAIDQGFVADVFSQGIQHDVAIGQHFQGGPLINSSGEVVGVASRAYAPLNFTSDGVYFGVPIQLACDRVLHCPSGGAASAGAQSTG